MPQVTINLDDAELVELSLHLNPEAGLATLEDVAEWCARNTLIALSAPDTSLPLDDVGRPLELLTIYANDVEREGLAALGEQFEVPVAGAVVECVRIVLHMLARAHADGEPFVLGLDLTGSLGEFLERRSVKSDDPGDFSPEDIIRPDDE